MSDNLSFLLTCAAECLNNWGYDGHGKHVEDGVKEITRLRAENEKLREALEDVIAAVHCTRSSIGVAIIDIEPISAARKALKESGDE